jgi:hypothetical protein
MRLLRGLGSQLLPCGCLAGVYETYHGATVSILDARNDTCSIDNHHVGLVVPTDSTKATIPVRAAAAHSGPDRRHIVQHISHFS